jgi:hypothetical protein
MPMALACASVARAQRSVSRGWWRGGDEGFQVADHCFFLRSFAGLQVLQSREHGLCGFGVAAQCCQPAAVAGEEFVVGEPIGVRGVGELGRSGVPVAEHKQRLGQVPDGH